VSIYHRNSYLSGQFSAGFCSSPTPIVVFRSKFVNESSVESPLDYQNAKIVRNLVIIDRRRPRNFLALWPLECIVLAFSNERIVTRKVEDNFPAEFRSLYFI